MQQGLDNSILMKLMGEKSMAQNITIRLAIVFKDKL